MRRSTSSFRLEAALNPLPLKMMPKVCLILLLAAMSLSQVLASAGSYTADMDFLHKQKKIYDLLYFIKQEPFLDSEYYDVARNYDIEGSFDYYTNKEIVQEFLWYYKSGFLKKNVLFTPSNEEHRREARILFKLFYYAKDFATFYKTACFARLNLNYGLFVNAFTAAVLYRPDTKYIRLPRPYEIFPNLYFDSTVINQAKDIKMTKGIGSTTSMDTTDSYLIYSNYTEYFLKPYFDEEYKLDYFTEDVGLNAYWYYVRNAYPFWLTLKDYDSEAPKYRGMFYYASLRQIMSRYYLERLSNGLGEIEYIDWYKSYMPGYYSTLAYSNGIAVPQRDRYTKLPSYDYKYLKDIEALEMRILSAIDSGFIIDYQGKSVDIYTPQGFELLCDIIEGNGESYNLYYYGSIDVLARDILGYNVDYKYKNQVIPSALQVFDINLRDPGFYRIYKKIMYYFLRYRERLPYYKQNELYYPGVKIESVSIDKFVTYFDYCDTLINNAVTFDSLKEAFSLRIKARRYCLNYKPFVYRFGVNSDKDTKSVIRIFLGPANYDSSVSYYEFLRYNYQNFFMLDKFVVNLRTGMNNIERRSSDSFFTYKDKYNGDLYYKKLEKAIGGGEPYTYNEKMYGFPDRLLLPKGNKEGTPYKLFIMVSPFEESKAAKVEFPVFGELFDDGKSMFYPLDRPMYPWAFQVPNMFFKDVYIYNQKEEEVPSGKYNY